MGRSYGTANPAKMTTICFQATPNRIATTIAITASLINVLRIRRQLAALCALETISCACFAALRSASERPPSRFRRFGPMLEHTQTLGVGPRARYAWPGFKLQLQHRPSCALLLSGCLAPKSSAA